jgi:hypothetical protein
MLVDGNTLYVGGSFTSVSGVTQRKIAAFDLTTDTLIPWNPNITSGSYVDAIAKNGNQIYLGGLFSVVNGTFRTNVVAVDGATAGVLPLVANADSFVYGLAATSNQLFIGGNFSSINNQKRSELACLDLNSGNLTPWNPGANAFVIDMNIYDGVLYASGGFFRAGGETTVGLAAFPLSLVGAPTIVSNSVLHLSGGALQFRVRALGVPQATVQSCTNLANWQPLQIIPLVAGNGIFTDPDAPNYPRRFYRLSVP